MSPLQKRITDFCKKNNIGAQDLEYEWKGKNGQETDSLFREFNRDLTNAIEGGIINEIYNVIVQIIHVWGKIINYSASAARYSNAICNLDENDPIGTEIRLPSWTKVLAAYNPKKFCIYDSRVVVALCVLFPEVKWFLTDSGNDQVKQIISFMKRKDSERLSAPESYKKYMELLNDSKDKVNLERQLFMLGGLLQYDPAKKKIVANSLMLSNKCKTCSYHQTRCSGKKTKKNK